MQTDQTASRKPALFSLDNIKSLAKGRLPGQVVIQYTDKCNASCVQCGMRQSNKYPRTTLNVDDTKRILDAMVERGVQAVSFTGGEPLLCLSEISECIRHARDIGIKYIRTGTNGFMFKGSHKADFEAKIHKIARNLAESGLYTFWVSVDSANAEMHEKNRGLPGTIAGMEKALPIFHEYGLYPSANLGINRYLSGYDNPPPTGADFNSQAFYDHFRQGFRQFYGFVESLGFTVVNACYPMSLDEADAAENAVYTATSEDDFIRFTPQEKLALFKALFDTIPEFRHRLRIFTPRSSLMALIRHYEGNEAASYPCRGGIDFFFIDSKDMNTYPCGYRGTENMGKFWDLDLNSIDKKAWCKQCDWECFRDPSELAGSLLDMFQQPLSLGKKLLTDRAYSKLWLEDMRYYRACQYFNATLAPDMQKLAKFKPERFRILKSPNSADISATPLTSVAP
ncbi:radical SAM protein [Candidatus Albibeggiatoa sp. nov. BB20]|uniref:radical SAM protein n=1 Tax=Candidatus Albibeggiatoa sp. nov. BB20 TaxID=3162723 RepID=UPI0033659BA5